MRVTWRAVKLTPDPARTVIAGGGLVHPYLWTLVSAWPLMLMGSSAFLNGFVALKVLRTPDSKSASGRQFGFRTWAAKGSFAAQVRKSIDPERRHPATSPVSAGLGGREPH
jgi:hypothetical protein